MERNYRAIGRSRRRYISYFGLGCRNVSKIFVPKGYSFTAFLFIYQDIIHYYENTLTITITINFDEQF
jgi:hypothetical protein